MPVTPDPILDQLVDLSHNLAREDRQLAILGEGNTSALAGRWHLLGQGLRLPNEHDPGA